MFLLYQMLSLTADLTCRTPVPLAFHMCLLSNVQQKLSLAQQLHFEHLTGAINFKKLLMKWLEKSFETW